MRVALKDLKAQTEIKVLLVLLALPDQLDQQVRKVLLALKALKVRLG